MGPPAEIHGNEAAIPELRKSPPPIALRRAFLALHWTLGVVVLLDSLLTTQAALQAPNSHLALLAGTESIAAVLFLMPATLRWGGGLLIATFALAFLAHAAQGDMHGPLLVYAAATAFVMVHSSAGLRHARTDSRFDANP
jgi:hypothetical protein